ncbi:type I phosphomannose isomerase catalytic subunit, partial [Deinococcus roseus]|uniref:type I phosphomannose isomerase catalytic subunit n=1 Tax=Deinococcus roseus TaxID=392414 RepID=UPI0035717689
MSLLQLVPELHHRVWGGHRLKNTPIPTEPHPEPIGEAWVVFEHNRVASGIHAGKTLSEVIAQQGVSLLGTRAWEKTGDRFPLLIKLLDCQDWLSIQVHPNDQQAQQFH